MFKTLYPLIKISFEPVFLFALLAAPPMLYRCCRHRRFPGIVPIVWWTIFFAMFMIRTLVNNSSSRYFASMSLWIIVAAAYFCAAPISLCTKRLVWIGRGLCILLTLATTVFCLIKNSHGVSRYSGYIMRLAKAMATDAERERNVLLLCTRDKLNRYSWYSGIDNTYHTLQFGLNGIDTPEELRKLMQPFRCYDGTVYIITGNRRNSDIEAKEVNVPASRWRLFTDSFTNRHRSKRVQIYKLSGGDLLRHETSLKSSAPYPVNRDFEGVAKKMRFLTIFPGAKAETGEFPQGWVPYLARIGHCRVGVKKGVMPNRGISLNWSGRGEFEVCNVTLIPPGARELSFCASGKADSEYGILMYLFDAQNKFLSRHVLAHLRISGDVPEKIVIAIPPPGSTDGKDTIEYAKFRIGVVYYRGEVNIDDWDMYRCR